MEGWICADNQFCRLPIQAFDEKPTTIACPPFLLAKIPTKLCRRKRLHLSTTLKRAAQFDLNLHLSL